MPYSGFMGIWPLRCKTQLGKKLVSGLAGWQAHAVKRDNHLIVERYKGCSGQDRSSGTALRKYWNAAASSDKDDPWRNPWAWLKLFWPPYATLWYVQSNKLCWYGYSLRYSKITLRMLLPVCQIMSDCRYLANQPNWAAGVIDVMRDKVKIYRLRPVQYTFVGFANCPGFIIG